MGVVYLFICLFVVGNGELLGGAGGASSEDERSGFSSDARMGEGEE